MFSVIMESRKLCEYCGKMFEGMLNRHIRTQHGDGVEVFKCEKCGRVFKRKDNLSRHRKTCERKPEAEEKKKKEREEDEEEEGGPPAKKAKVLTEQSTSQKVAKLFRAYTFNPESEDESLDPMLFLKSVQLKITQLLHDQPGAVKWYVVYSTRFRKDDGENVKEEVIYRRCKNRYLHLTDKDMERCEEDLAEGLQSVYSVIDDFVGKEGSGWTFVQNNSMELHVADYKPLAGSSYVELPQELLKKRALLNIKNKDDNKCFMWSILAKLHPCTRGIHNETRVSSYDRYRDELNLTGINFPVTLSDIRHFEKKQ